MSFFKIDFRERGKGWGERYQFVVPLNYAFIG